MIRKLLIATLAVLSFGGIIAFSASPALVTAAPCTRTGNDRDNFMSGTAGRDVLCARSGNDFVSGHAGADIIKAGPGDDNIVGNEGPDLLRGMAGNDRIFSNNGHGSDRVRGGTGFDRCYIDDGDIAVGCENTRIGPTHSTVMALTDVVGDATSFGDVLDCDPAVEVCTTPPPPGTTTTPAPTPPPVITITVTVSAPPMLPQCTPPPANPPASC